ncbi:MAG TPA: NAD(P)H-dependent oxidoreductase subunit E [Fervidobacterium sp.]|nr:NAD(P)H-dependent oxidoreductase subunit E [Fervidobacterium sp.]HRB91496.1 NAD(P)H-dependent oxidoreductase subunit E [Fervidobacterium sp.]
MSNVESKGDKKNDQATTINIKICLGSSCHLKGAYEITQKLKEVFSGDPNVLLSGSLCMNNCANGVSIEINGELVSKVTPGNLEETVIRKVMEKKGRMVSDDETK